MSGDAAEDTGATDRVPAARGLVFAGRARAIIRHDTNRPRPVQAIRAHRSSAGELANARCGATGKRELLECAAPTRDA